LRLKSGEYLGRGFWSLVVGLGGIAIIYFFLIELDKIDKITNIVGLVLASVVICFSLTMCFHGFSLQDEATQKYNTLQESIPTAGSKLLAGIEPLISTLERCGFSTFK
jgi:hypothetical protein